MLKQTKNNLTVFVVVHVADIAAVTTITMQFH